MTDETAIIPDSISEASNLPIQAPQTSTLFQTTDPITVIDKATKVATRLAGVIKQQHLYADIRGKHHVTVSGWTLLGSLLGVFPITVWTRKLENGWEARVEARTLAGNLVGAAEAQCLTSESSWSNREDFALRSMAQTRATSKAMRMPLGYIVQLAGFDATPAEEMGFMKSGTAQADIRPPVRKQPAPKPKVVKPKPKPRQKAKAIEMPEYVETEIDNHMAMEQAIDDGEALPEEEQIVDHANLDDINETLKEKFGNESRQPTALPRDKHGQMTHNQFLPVFVNNFQIFKGIGQKSQKPYEIHKYVFEDVQMNGTLYRAGTWPNKQFLGIAHQANYTILLEDGDFNPDPEKGRDNSDPNIVWVCLKEANWTDGKGAVHEAWDLRHIVADEDWVA